jgi:hypothetical protein
MEEVSLKITEQSADGPWEAELRTGYPGLPQATLIAGQNGQFTVAQLEASMQMQGQAVVLTRKTMLDFIAGNLNPVPPGMADAIGQRLFDLLSATGVAGKLLDLRRRPDRVRIYLSLPSGLAQLPWEFLARPVGLNSDRLFVDPRNPIVRVHHAFTPEMEYVDSAVRVLLVSGEETLDAANKAADELRKIRGVFHRSGVSALVHLCEAPDERQLKACLEDFNPHILHFTGHGNAFGGPASEFELKFQLDDHHGNVRIWRWPASAIYQYFSRQAWKPRLVVLNACHGAGAAKDAAAIAESLLDAGIAAVIGAQAELSVDYARCFAETFYGTFAVLAAGSDTGASLDAAAASARDIWYRDPRLVRQWALPVLTVNAPIDRIVRFKRAHTKVMSCDVVREVFVRTGRFVNRATDRWKLISTFQPAADQKASPGLILMGDNSLGKSWLIKRAIRDFLDSGFILAYATLTGKTERSSVHVLADWHGDPVSPSYLRRSMAGPHFAAFEQELDKARQAVPDDGFRSLFGEFVKGLQTLRGSRPVLLILDQFAPAGDSGLFSISPQDFNQGLLRQLLFPMNSGDKEVAGIFALLIIPVRQGVPVPAYDANVAAGDVDALTLQQLVVNNRIPEYVGYGLSDLDRFRTLQVPRLPAAEAQNLFDEFADFQTNTLVEALRGAFVLMGEKSWRGQDGADFLETFDVLVRSAMASGTQAL